MQRNKVNIEFNQEEQDIANVIIFLETHEDIYKDWNRKFSARHALDNCLKKKLDISYDQILKICAKTWEVKENELLERPNHNKGILRIQILSFYHACGVFNNGEYKEFESFMGRSTYSMFGTRANEEIVRHVEQKSVYSKSILKLFKELLRECPDRISNAIEEFDQLQKAQIQEPVSLESGHPILAKKLLFKLICINAGKIKIKEPDGKKIKTFHKELEFLGRYGAYEALMDKGRLYYRLLNFTDFKDRVYLAERFHVVK